MRRRVAAVVVLLGAASALAWVTPGRAAVVHSPRLGAGPSHGTTAAGWSSSNWSGYAITGSGFTAITGQWRVPAVSPSRKSSYSSNWIGIDGFNNNNLIQTGTESDYVSGSARYDAWWEILPAAETVIPSVPVKPGDLMSASVKRNSGSSWTITISDVTTGASFSTTQTYTGPETSAEWIEEAPSIGGRIAPLANYGTATFDPGTVNGLNPHLVASEGGVMIQGRSQVSTPSNPDADTDGFSTAYGSSAPPPPAS
jgi:hypothetical protein